VRSGSEIPVSIGGWQSIPKGVTKARDTKNISEVMNMPGDGVADAAVHF
jgi:hypothetical protein